MPRTPGDAYSPPFKIVVADEHRLPAGLQVPRAAAKFNAILLTLSGGADMIHEAGRVPLKPGNMLWIREGYGLGVEVGADQAVNGIYIHFTAPADWTTAQPTIKKIHGSPLAFQIMQQLADASPGDLAVIGPDLVQVLVKFIHNSRRLGSGARWQRLPTLLRKCIDLFRAHPERAYTLKSLCASLGTTSSTLCRQFKERLGAGPLEVLQRLRLEQAAQRLELGEEQVGEVAAALGFSNQFFFTRCFTKAYGLSPKAYRDRARKGVFKHWRLVHANVPNALEPF